MIKNFFINNRIKKSKKTEAHDTYEKAERLGILFNADEFGPATIHEAQMALENDRKFVSKLGFTNVIPKDLTQLEESAFTRKDISPTGSIRKTSVTKFIEKPFDFLISLDTSSDINYKYVLASSNAICKVGFQANDYENLLTMFMKPSADKNKCVKDLISYLKKI